MNKEELFLFKSSTDERSVSSLYLLGSLRLSTYQPNYYY